MEMKIELIPIPVTDVDRAIEFYKKVGFILDHDHVVHENLRFVQLTPPGSACSIVIGKGISPMKPGSIDAYQVVIKNAKDAREHLLHNGIEVSEVDVQPWGNFVYFHDPDGNKWSLQEIPQKNSSSIR